MLGRDVRARSRFDRFTHHAYAYGHGASIAAIGGIGSRFLVARRPTDGVSGDRVCRHTATVSV